MRFWGYRMEKFKTKPTFWKITVFPFIQNVKRFVPRKTSAIDIDTRWAYRGVANDCIWFHLRCRRFFVENAIAAAINSAHCAAPALRRDDAAARQQRRRRTSCIMCQPWERAQETAPLCDARHRYRSISDFIRRFACIRNQFEHVAGVVTRSTCNAL